MSRRKFAAALAALVLASGLTVGLADPALGASLLRDPEPPIPLIKVVNELFDKRVAQQRREAERLTALMALAERMPVWPVVGSVTSEFGWRWGTMHLGLDVAAPSGTPLVAVRAGVVVFSRWDGGYGNKVVVDHGDGVQTVYAHNRANVVAPGQVVGKGEVIAYVGSTGYSTGPHVHFEVHVDAVPQDPRSFLPPQTFR